MVAEESGYATGGDGADPGAGEVGAIGAEAEAVLGTDRRNADSWDVSRAKCALYGIATPLAIVIPLALVTAGGALTSDATDPAQREFEEKAVALVLVAIFGGIGLLAAREFVVLAVFGGGLAASREGLHFAWGRRTMLFRWEDVNRVAVEEHTSGRGVYQVLVVRFARDYRWPRAFSLWFSQPARLCITPYILADPAEVIVKDLGAAREQHTTDGVDLGGWPPATSTARGRPVVYTQEIRAGDRKSRWIAGSLVGVALVLWAAFCAWGVIEAVAASDLGLVIGRGLMGLATGAIGLALLLKGDVIRKAWDEA